MEKVRVLKVYKSDKDKAGKTFVAKNGKPFWKVAIQTDKTQNDWYSCLAFGQEDRVMRLKEGDEVDIIFETEGQYKNFSLPSRLDLLELRVKNLEDKLLTSAGTKVPDFSEVDLPDNDVPF